MQLVDYSTAQIWCMAGNNPSWLFLDKGGWGRYDLRGTLNMKQPTLHTALKSMCISVCGVKLGNSLPDEKKKVKILKFKKNFKNLILKYGLEGSVEG